jgi:hypothetical protein
MVYGPCRWINQGGFVTVPSGRGVAMVAGLTRIELAGAVANKTNT